MTTQLRIGSPSFVATRPVIPLVQCGGMRLFWVLDKRGKLVICSNSDDGTCEFLTPASWRPFPGMVQTRDIFRPILEAHVILVLEAHVLRPNPGERDAKIRLIRLERNRSSCSSWNATGSKCWLPGILPGFYGVFRPEQPEQPEQPGNPIPRP